jgi:hypothetical protein
MRLDPNIVDHPRKHLRRAIGRIADQALRFELEALLDSLDHHPRRCHFFLTIGGRGFNVNDNPGIRINQVVR